MGPITDPYSAGKRNYARLNRLSVDYRFGK